VREEALRLLHYSHSLTYDFAEKPQLHQRKIEEKHTGLIVHLWYGCRMFIPQEKLKQK
jgi:hypothetical protein